RLAPSPLVEVLQLDLSMTPATVGQQVAQHEMAAAVENALDARRQRIIISRSEVDAAKWACLFVQSVCVLLAIALVHIDDRPAAALTMSSFAPGAVPCVLLIPPHARPFPGHLPVPASPLLQVMPEAAPASSTRPEEAVRMGKDSATDQRDAKGHVESPCHLTK